MAAGMALLIHFFCWSMSLYKTLMLPILLQLPVETLVNQVLEAPGLQEWFKGAIEVGNPDALLLALKLREKISMDGNFFGKLLPDPYSPSAFFSADHLLSLSNCLKVIFRFELAHHTLPSRYNYF